MLYKPLCLIVSFFLVVVVVIAITHALLRPRPMEGGASLFLSPHQGRAPVVHAGAGHGGLARKGKKGLSWVQTRWLEQWTENPTMRYLTNNKQWRTRPLLLSVPKLNRRRPISLSSSQDRRPPFSYMAHTHCHHTQMVSHSHTLDCWHYSCCLLL